MLWIRGPVWQSTVERSLLRTCLAMCFSLLLDRGELACSRFRFTIVSNELLLRLQDHQLCCATFSAARLTFTDASPEAEHAVTVALA